MRAAASSESGFIPAASMLTALALTIISVSAVITENFLIQWVLYPVPFSFFVLSLVLTIGAVTLRLGQKIVLDRTSVTIICGLFVPMLVSMAFFPIAIILQPRWYVNSFILEPGFWGRMINIILYLATFTFVASVVVSKPDMLRRLIKGYVGCLIALLIGAYWQLASFKFGVPFPKFGMETRIHGVDAEVGFAFANRLTSFVREPAFLVSFIFDLIILAPLIMQKKVSSILVLLCVPVLVFTYSVSAVVHIVWLAIVYGGVKMLILLSRLRARPSTFFITTLVCAGCILGLIASISLLAPYTDRIGRILSDPTRDVRIFEIWVAVQGMLSSPFLVAIFGHGPGSYAILQYVDLGLGKTVWHQTSNNQYADTLFESGLFGFASIVMLIAWMLHFSVKLAIRNPRLSSLPLFVIHISGTGLFKAQIFNLRYYVMLWIIIGIIALYRSDNRNIVYIPRELMSLYYMRLRDYSYR